MTELDFRAATRQLGRVNPVRMSGRVTNVIGLVIEASRKQLSGRIGEASSSGPWRPKNLGSSERPLRPTAMAAPGIAAALPLVHSSSKR